MASFERVEELNEVAFLSSFAEWVWDEQRSIQPKLQGRDNAPQTENRTLKDVRTREDASAVTEGW
jgi:hypothetical protein